MYWVYCIECVTPNHLYVGQSRKVDERLLAHVQGKVPFTLRHGVKRWCLVTTSCCIDSIRRLEVEEYRRLKSEGYVVGGFSTLEGCRVGYAIGEWAVEGPQPSPAVPISMLLAPPPAKPIIPPTQFAIDLQIVLNDPLLPTLRSKARRLAELHDLGEDTALSRIRRSRGAVSLGAGQAGRLGSDTRH